MTYSKIKNSLFWIFATFWILFVFLYYFNIPVSGDYWFSKWELQNIYSFSRGFHPGRNFGEILTIIPRNLSSWLFFIPEPLYRYKFLCALLDTFLYVSLIGISCHIVPKHKKITALFLGFFYFYTTLTWTVVNIIAVLPMLYVSILPAIYYLRDHTLPIWMKENPYKTLGYWAVFCYMGTQVYDPTYFMGGSFFGLVVLYLIYEYYISKSNLKDKVSYKIVLTISIFYIAVMLFAITKNIFMSDKFLEFAPKISFNPIQLIQNFKLIMVIVLVIPISYYIYLYFTKKLKDNCCVEIFLVISSFTAAMGVYITQSPSTDYIIWSVIIVIATIITELWDKKPWMQVVLPTIILGLFINILLLHQEKMKVNTIDMQLIRIFQQAESQGQDTVTLSSSEFARLGLHEPAARLAPHTIVMLGYTSKLLSVVIVETNTNNEIVTDTFDPLSKGYFDKITTTNTLN